MTKFQDESVQAPKLIKLAEALQRAADAVSRLGAWLASICIVFMTLLVLLDTLLAFFSGFLEFVPASTGIGWEYSAYLMGASFLLGAGLTLRAGLQLRVELSMSSKNTWVTRTLETFSAALGSVTTVSLTIWLAHFTYRTWTYGEVSQDSFTPLWIPQLVLTFGASILAFQMVARLVSCLFGLTVNRPEIGAVSPIK